MARVLITGSAGGLGLMAAQTLVRDGHDVVLHARDEGRINDALASVPGVAGHVVGDLSSIAATMAVAEAANATGRFDAVVHNAAIGPSQSRRVVTVDGLSATFAVNVLAPYLLTALVEMPRRLVYLSSGMHRGGSPELGDLQWEQRPWSGSQAYADSKLFVAALAVAMARLRPDVLSNAVDPGWVPTTMGGPWAPDDISLGSVTQVWLAVSDDPDALVSGRFLYHQRVETGHPALHLSKFQDELLATCGAVSGIRLPASSS